MRLMEKKIGDNALGASAIKRTQQRQVQKEMLHIPPDVEKEIEDAASKIIRKYTSTIEADLAKKLQIHYGGIQPTGPGAKTTNLELKSGSSSQKNNTQN